MNKKLEYLTPEVDVFTVQTEGVVCASMDGNIENGTLDDWGSFSAPFFEDFNLL